MKRIALFLDGTSRATLIPFAPVLIGQLLKAGSGTSYYLISTTKNGIDGVGDDDGSGGVMNDNVNAIPEELWSSITWATAGMIAIYMIGRAAGTLLGAHSAWVQYMFSSDRRRQNEKSRAYSRTIGAILALHLFSFGAGIHRLPTLYVIRFCMGFLVGLLLRVASYPGACKIQDNEQSLETLVENGVAKVWLAGFAISMLTSGVLYAPLSRSPLFVMLTGGDGNSSRPWEWIVSTLFFIVMIFVTENVCQFCCGKFMTSSDDDDEDRDDVLNGTHNDEYDMVIPSRGDTLLKKRNVSRESSSSSSPGKSSSTSNSVNSAHWNSNRPRLGSNGGREGRLSSVDISGHSNHHHQNRLRLDSNYSTKSDVFFDCESQCDGVSVSWGLDEEIVTGTGGLTDASSSTREYKDHSLSIAKYENGKCVYDDGSPSPVQVGLCASTTPKSFYAIHKSKADAKWEESKKWRIENRLWKIHALPHVLYGKIKDSYPHHIHGHTKSGYPIMYERPGGMSLKKKFSDGSLTVDDMKYHYIHQMEYFANVICQLPECRERLDHHRPTDQQVSTWGFFIVMDVSGLSLSVLSGDVLRYLQGAGAINEDHYPHSTAHALVVNSPFWLSGAFSRIKSILPDNTTVDLFSSSNQLEGLRKFIDDDQIPQEFGGSSPYPLGEHPYEKRLADLVESCKDVVDDGEADDYFFDHPRQHVVQANNEPQRFTPAPTNIVSMESLREVQEYNDGLNHFDVENDGGEMAHLMSPQLGRSSSEISEHEHLFDQADQSGLSLRYGYKWENAKYHSEEYVFFMISAIHCIWCALQGSLETLLSVWLLSPQTLGGLGYEPRRSGFALFTAAIVVLWLQRSAIAKFFVHIPTNSPLRGYRIGVGAEVFLLLLLPFVPFISNFDNMLVLTTNILLGVLISIASILGRLSLARLHSIASSAYVGKVSLSCDTRTKLGQTLNMVANFVQKGGFTYVLGVSGEVVGSVIVAPIIVWSAKVEHHFPIDTSLSFYTGAGLCAILYMLSFSFKVTGEIPNCEFDSIQQGSYHSVPSSTRCSIFRDICAVSVSDVASLFEESNWTSTSSSSTLGRHSANQTGTKRV